MKLLGLMGICILLTACGTKQSKKVRRDISFDQYNEEVQRILVSN